MLNGRIIGFSLIRVIPKTMALITGEFNIDDLMEDGAEILGNKEIIYILFLVFVIFCCHIVLMNVFTGLAVGDVATIMSESEQIKESFQLSNRGPCGTLRATQLFARSEMSSKRTHSPVTNFF